MSCLPSKRSTLSRAHEPPKLSGTAGSCSSELPNSEFPRGAPEMRPARGCVNGELTVLRTDPFSAPQKPRVLLVDDFPPLLQQATRLLGNEFEVIGTLPDGSTLVEDRKQWKTSGAIVPLKRSARRRGVAPPFSPRERPYGLPLCRPCAPPCPRLQC